jgi:hypothetical protein
MKRSVITVVALLLLDHALPICAQDIITVAQSNGGAITATLTETIGACGGGAFGVGSIVQTGGAFTIEAAIVAVPSPGPCGPPVTSTYQVSALLGSLPDGLYDVFWTYPGGGTFAHASFRIMNGLLQSGPEPVPALGAVQVVLLAILIMSAGALSFRVDLRSQLRCKRQVIRKADASSPPCTDISQVARRKRDS